MSRYILLDISVILASLIRIECQTDNLIRSQGIFQFKEWTNATGSTTMPRGAMMDLAMKAMSPLPRTGSLDVFGFLRDSYTLPGGKCRD